MSTLLRSTRSKLFSSSPSSLSRTFPSPPTPSSPSPTPFSSRTFSSLHSSSPLSLRTQIGALAPLLERFHRHTATTSIANENPLKGNLTSLPKPGGGEFGKFYGVPSITDFSGVPAVVDAMNNKLGSDSNKINPLRYKASGQETIVLAGAGYGNGSSRYWAAKGPMLFGVDAVIAKSFVRHYASGVPSKTSEIKPHILRPLSPHLPIYEPQLSSTSSIFNRISGAFLASIVLLFYVIYMKMGLICLTFDTFYQFLFYSSKLNLIAVEISALALSYHLYQGIRHLAIIV